MKNLVTALKKVVADSDMDRFKKLAMDTDFENFHNDKELNEVMENYSITLSDLDDEQLKMLFMGDYEIGKESHYFNDAERTSDFIKEAGEIIGWDM